MLLELKFTTGRFHATAWGRHVNEAVPEWPPSPFRIARALLDAWYRKHPDIPASVVERLLERMSTPPRFALPPARASHTRSFLRQGSEDPTDKKLVFDGFAVVDKNARVFVGWPEVLDPETAEAARRLLRDLNYLGRSEAWVEARLVDDRAVQWNCAPIEEGVLPDGKECVSVACVVPPEVYARRDVTLPGTAKGKKAKDAPLSWLTALGWGIAETMDHAMNRPPALEPVLYVRDADALDARPRERSRASPLIEGALYSVEGKVRQMRVPITQALWVAEAARQGLMRHHARLAGEDRLSWRITGKAPDGSPRLGGHEHLSFLPLDADRDGWIDHLLVLGRGALDDSELMAMDRLSRIWKHERGAELVLTPVRWSTGDGLREVATEVISLTPFIPTRHRRKGRDGDQLNWLAGQIGRECANHGMPLPVEVRWLDRPASAQRHARWLDFKRARRKDEEGPRLGYGLRVRFAEAVRAPFSLGYGSHFGLGCFVIA